MAKSSVLDEQSGYDAVVIGAGAGGLAAGLLLARAGMKTAVLEHHASVGGYCASFARRGFMFDAAAHCLSSIGNDRTPIGQLFSRCGLDVRYLEAGEQRVHLGVRHHRFRYDMEHLRGLLKAHFPQEGTGIDGLLTTARKIYLGYSSRGLGSAVCERYQHATYRQLLEEFVTKKELMTLLSFTWPFLGLPPRESSAIAMAILLHELFANRVYQVEGGAQRFSDGVREAILRHGGHVATRTRVARILTSGGRAVGVETVAGARLRARHVISNCDARQTFGKLLDAGSVDPTFRRGLEGMKESVTSFMLYLGVEIDDDTAARLQGFHFDDADMNDGRACPLTVAVPSLADRSLAPPRGHVVVVQALFDAVAGVARGRPKAYYAALVLDRLQLTLDQDGGRACELRACIRVMESADAHTLHRYTLNSNGASYGWAKTPDQFVFDHLNDHGVESLQLVGHWTSFGFGVSGAIYSAMRVAQRLLAAPAQDGEGERTAGPGSVPAQQ